MHRDPQLTAAWTQAAFLAEVVSLDDPERRARVQVKLHAFSDADGQAMTTWARVVAPFAGMDRGAFFLPDVGDEVLVSFVQGDPRFPLILGGLWNGNATPPAEVESGGQNRYKRIKSKNGIVVTLDDQTGQETLTLETPGGQRLTLKDGPGNVVVEDSNGNSVKLEPAGITINAAAKVTVRAAQVQVSAGTVNVDTAMASFSGVVRCNTLIATSVVSASYTPGAGNVW